MENKVNVLPLEERVITGMNKDILDVWDENRNHDEPVVVTNMLAKVPSKIIFYQVDYVFIDPNKKLVIQHRGNCYHLDAKKGMELRLWTKDGLDRLMLF